MPIRQLENKQSGAMLVAVEEDFGGRHKAKGLRKTCPGNCSETGKLGFFGPGGGPAKQAWSVGPGTDERRWRVINW